MDIANQIPLYKKYHMDRDDERLGLFLILSENFPIKRTLLCRKFCSHNSLFFFPTVVYVDNDKQAKDFFNNPTVYNFISKKKRYEVNPTITFN